MDFAPHRGQFVTRTRPPKGNASCEVDTTAQAACGADAFGHGTLSACAHIRVAEVEIEAASRRERLVVQTQFDYPWPGSRRAQ
jgi:hypothetical protein